MTPIVNQPVRHLWRGQAARSLSALLVGTVWLLGSCSGPKSITIALPKSIVEYETVNLVEGHELAAQAYHTENPEKAIRKYQAAIQTYQQLPAAWNNLGVLLMEQGGFVQASEAFKQAAELSPSDPRPVYNLGVIWDRRGYVREARTFYAKAIRRDRSYLPALRAAIRADAVLSEGSDQTLEWLERALMREQDKKWRDWMKLQRVRIEQQLSSQTES